MPGDPFPDGRRRTVYAVSSPLHDFRDYDVFESYQPWWRPIPVSEAEYIGTLAHHECWRRLHLGIDEKFDNLWRVLMRSGQAHLQIWCGYHLNEDGTVSGLDLYFNYWKPYELETQTWERYWLQDSL